MVDSFWRRGFATMVGGSRTPPWRPGCRCAPRTNGWRSPRRLPRAAIAEIERLRRQRLSGPQIARKLGRPVAAVGLVLRRRGLGRRAALEPRPAVIRCQRAGPGELLHIDPKKLGRIDGVGHRITGEPVAAAAGRSSTSPSTMPQRLAYSEIPPDARTA